GGSDVHLCGSEYDSPQRRLSGRQRGAAHDGKDLHLLRRQRQRPRQRAGAGRGMVLMSCLTILAVLLAVGLGTRVMIKNDYQALANLRGGTEAFYYSAAGIE